MHVDEVFTATEKFIRFTTAVFMKVSIVWRFSVGDKKITFLSKLGTTLLPS